MIFGTLFLVDGLLQCTAAWMVRYRRWNVAFAWGVVEILLAIFFYQPYPTHYVGTVPYCLGLLLMFGGMHMLSLAARVRRLTRNPAFATSPAPALAPDLDDARDRPHFAQSEWDGPPADGEHALTVHVWTPTGTSKAEAQRYPVIDRYIAAVDVNGVISTGHAALESPEGHLYQPVSGRRNRSFSGRIHAHPACDTRNDVPGLFQPDYATESKAWCPSTVRVRIRNYDPSKLDAFWTSYRQNLTYNLTHRNCSSTVSNALEAALDGAVWRLKGARGPGGARSCGCCSRPSCGSPRRSASAR